MSRVEESQLGMALDRTRVKRWTWVADCASLLKQAGMAWVNDGASSMGAALAYYTLFSLAPLLVVVIAVAGLVFGEEAARGEVVTQLTDLMGPEGAAAVQGILKGASRPGGGVVATVIGTLTLLLGATSVFGELQSALARVWQAPLAPPGAAWAFLRGRLLSFGLIVSLGFLLLVSLVLSAALAALESWSDQHLPGGALPYQILNLLVSLGVSTFLFALIFRILPPATVAWHDAWVGAVATAVLFNLGKQAIGLYLGTAGVASSFGAAGSLIVLLIWVYYSAQVFLLGAEFTRAFALRHTPLAPTAGSAG
jgi:membrane protein